MLFDGCPVRKFGRIGAAAHRRLLRLDAAASLRDLAAIPGNRLERLHGDRVGQHSIRINERWRVCFVWQEDDLYDVEIVDYH